MKTALLPAGPANTRDDSLVSAAVIGLASLRPDCRLQWVQVRAGGHYCTPSYQHRGQTRP